MSTYQARTTAPRIKRTRRFDRNACRRREIERHAIHIGAADSDDLSRWLIAWVWHNQQSKAPIDALLNAAYRMGRDGMTEAEAEAILGEATVTRRRMSADNLARFLGVTYEQRDKIGLTTIGATDVGKRARLELRKRKMRLAKERKRREQGARPQALSLSRTKPWQAEGLSRAQWYRRRPQRNETVSAPAVSLSTGDEVVSPAPPLESGRPSDGVSADAAVPVAAAAVTAIGAALAATPAVDELVLAANHARLARGVDRGVAQRAA